jgi:hypothetical protein
MVPKTSYFLFGSASRATPLAKHKMPPVAIVPGNAFHHVDVRHFLFRILVDKRGIAYFAPPRTGEFYPRKLMYHL